MEKMNSTVNEVDYFVYGINDEIAKGKSFNDYFIDNKSPILYTKDTCGEKLFNKTIKQFEDTFVMNNINSIEEKVSKNLNNEKYTKCDSRFIFDEIGCNDFFKRLNDYSNTHKDSIIPVQFKDIKPNDIFDETEKYTYAFVKFLFDNLNKTGLYVHSDGDYLPFLYSSAGISEYRSVKRQKVQFGNLLKSISGIVDSAIEFNTFCTNNFVFCSRGYASLIDRNGLVITFYGYNIEDKELTNPVILEYTFVGNTKDHSLYSTEEEFNNFNTIINEFITGKSEKTIDLVLSKIDITSKKSNYKTDLIKELHLTDDKYSYLDAYTDKGFETVCTPINEIQAFVSTTF